MINESEIAEEIQKDKNIRYFKLPEDNGWNSGRAVLISQVQTEYFVTCDDDFSAIGSILENTRSRKVQAVTVSRDNSDFMAKGSYLKTFF